MTKRRLLSSVTAAATMVGACLFLAPTAHAASGSCTYYPNGLPKSCTDGTTTCNIVYSTKFPFIPTVRCP
jgi:hypothetical protein